MLLAKKMRENKHFIEEGRNLIFLRSFGSGKLGLYG